MKKRQLGQFFTKNSDRILKGLEKYIRGKEVIDPFAGKGDLIMWARKHKARKIKGYEIDEKYIDNKNIFFNDSIKEPLKYKFVLTNPPYLNINKASRKIKNEYFKNHEFEDLYQISLKSILNSDEGIVIVPVNFLSARNSKKIKEIFFSKFKIVKMNYFRNQVFSDTTNNVIAFYYKKKDNLLDNKFIIETHLYPENKKVFIELKKNASWYIHGEFLDEIKKQKNQLGIRRLVEKDIDKVKKGIQIPVAFNHIDTRLKIKVSKEIHDLVKKNIIFLKAIDSGTENGKLSLDDLRKYNVRCLISKESSRHMIHLIFKDKIPIKEQEKIIDIFNKEINNMRNDYLSLFLTNFRDNDRKRISFDFVYKFINYLYYQNISKNYVARQSSLF